MTKDARDTTPDDKGHVHTTQDRVSPVSTSPFLRLFSAAFFVLRTPLLPFDVLSHWNDQCGSCDATHRDEKTYEAVCEHSRHYLSNLCSTPEIREAIWIASHDLYKALICQTAGHSNKVERSVTKYLFRMAGRPTPFGLFAGCSIGTIATQTDLTLSPLSAYRRHCRVDHGYLYAIGEQLRSHPDTRARTPFHVNTSLYTNATQVKYAEAHSTATGRVFSLIAADRDPFLDSVVEFGRSGPHLLSEFARVLMADGVVAEPEALSYLHELVDAQILEGHFAPALTSDDSLHDMLAMSQSTGLVSETVDHLTHVRSLLIDLNVAPIGQGCERYAAIDEALRSIKGVPSASPIQVDMFKPGDLTLGRDVVDDILKGTQALRDFAGVSPDPLAAFKERFRERYDTETVALVEALDEDSGIGLASGDDADGVPIVDGLQLKRTRPPGESAFSPRDAWLLRLLERSWTTGQTAIDLIGEERPVSEERMLPDSFAVTCSIGNGPKGREILLRHVSGPSGIRLLGRFCHLDPSLREHVERHLRAEEMLNPAAVFAEVVHLPGTRIGNVQTRPRLREYEIPFLGRGTAPPSKQIDINDLLLTLEGDTLRLTSQRLGCEVIPRMSTAVTFARGPAVYRFLCLLQVQQMGDGLIWNWGPFADAEHLPRIHYGNIVLSRERWRISEVDRALWLGQSPKDAFFAIRSWRERRSVPRWAVVVQGDNELPVDLDNPMCVDTLVSLMHSRSIKGITELLPRPENLLVTGPEGQFANEVIVPFVRSARNESPSTVRSIQRHHQRICQLGSECTYLKLYCGPMDADALLSRTLKTTLQALLLKRAITDWFYIRYSDPWTHLRVRLFGESQPLVRDALPALVDALAGHVSSKRITNMQLDSYRREVERYGGPLGVGLAERLFCADSRAVVSVLSDTESLPATDRWQLAIYLLDRMMTDFALSYRDRIDLLAPVSPLPKPIRRSLGDRYRLHRHIVESVLGGYLASQYEVLAETSSVRSTEFSAIASELKAGLQRGVIVTPLGDLMRTFIHMHINRLLRSAQWQQEIVICDFLRRTYESRAARDARACVVV
jgi:thiopeptide-type bacteriocin biosynthesis protein